MRNSPGRKKVSVYAAGPLFSQAERTWNSALAEYIDGRENSPFRILLPQETSPVEKGPEAIYRHCRRSVEKADIILANLDGPDVDSGTAWEVGYALGLGKPVVAYRTDFRVCEVHHANIMLWFGYEERIVCVEPTDKPEDTFERIYAALVKVAKRITRCS